MEYPVTKEIIRIDLDYDSLIRTSVYDALIGALVDYMDNYLYKKKDSIGVNLASTLVHNLLFCKKQDSKFLNITQKERETLSVAIDYIQDNSLRILWENLLLISFLNFKAGEGQV